jgi:hypothetical protein
MAIIDMGYKTAAAVDPKTYCIGLFIDSAKAFDTVSRQVLLEKLANLIKAYEAMRRSLWFQSCLLNIMGDKA